MFKVPYITVCLQILQLNHRKIQMAIGTILQQEIDMTIHHKIAGSDFLWQFIFQHLARTAFVDHEVYIPIFKHRRSIVIMQTDIGIRLLVVVHFAKAQVSLIKQHPFRYIEGRCFVLSLFFMVITAIL